MNLSKGTFTDLRTIRVYSDKVAYQAQTNFEASRSSEPLFSMAHVELTIGSKWVVNDRVYVIDGVNGHSIHLICGQEVADYTQSAFLSLVSEGKVEPLTAVKEAVQSDEAAEIMRSASPAARQEANRRFNILNNPSGEEAQSIADRTLRDWQQAFQKAEARYGSGYIGLLPRTYQRGNRTPRYPREIVEIAEEIITEHYETVVQPNAWQTYGIFRNRCEEAGFALIPSSKWFNGVVNNRDAYAKMKARRGRRAAYALKPRDPSKPHEDPACYPMAVVQLDHTLLDIELLCSTTGVNLGRPWISLMIDVFSRRVMAFVVSFDAPSSRSCMLLLRECVKRWGRLPATLYVDNGKEFHSVHFETLAARYHCTIKWRPPASARHGALIERYFGVLNSELINNLSGNTQIMKCVRQVTSAVNPKGHAVWTLERLCNLLVVYCHEIYDTRPHSSLGVSPADKFTRGLEDGGVRTNRQIVYDENFRIETLPTTPRGKAKVQPGRGVKVHSRYFYAPELRSTKLEGSTLPVRFDPYDAGTAYVFGNNHWIECRSEFYHQFRGRSEKEVMAASEELRRRTTVTGARRPANAGELARFIQSVKPEEMASRQRLKDMAMKAISIDVAAEPDVERPDKLHEDPSNVVGNPEDGTAGNASDSASDYVEYDVV